MFGAVEPARALGISHSLIICPPPGSFPGCRLHLGGNYLPTTPLQANCISQDATTTLASVQGLESQQLFNPPTTPTRWGSTQVSSLSQEGRDAAIPTSPSTEGTCGGAGGRFSALTQCFNYTIIPPHSSCSVSNVRSVSQSCSR